MIKNNKNKISNLDNLALDIYSNKEFVSSYANKIEYNSHNALYERPATLSLLPEVIEKKVLDAGCGPGAYSEWLIDKGAIVTAIDYSDEMVEFTKERVGDKVKVVKANLNFPLTFLKEEEFDIIISSMVLHYIKDWRNLFSEFNRILKVNGTLVFSTGHPCMDFYLHPEGDYFQTEIIEEEWPSYNIKMKSYKRPLGDIFKILKETDFTFDEMLEPQPIDECKDKFPDAYETLSKKPWFICFRAIKEK